MAKQLAIPDPNHPHVVTFGDGKRMTRADAKNAGHTIHGDPDVVVATASDLATKAHQSWRTSIFALPDARQRPGAAAELITSQTHDTMTVASARAFLRGLPHEQPEGPETVTASSDPKATRLAEIDSSMATFNKNNNVYGAKKPAAIASSLSMTDPVKLKRLAEIRLGAITTRLERGESSLSGEQKKLAYALSVHAQTGSPLATVFTQLGVDTSIMLKESAR